MSKENDLKQVLKSFYYKFLKSPGSNITWNVDNSAFHVSFQTSLAKIDVRIYEEYLIVFSNHKDYHCTRLESVDNFNDLVENIITDCFEKF